MFLNLLAGRSKIIILLLIIVFVLGSCTVLTRSALYYKADIDDHKIFPHYEMEEPDEKFIFQQGKTCLSDSFYVDVNDTVKQGLNPFLESTSTTAFLVIRNDSILFEEYFGGYSKEDISTFFSVSKSVTSLLVGIAIDEGYISGINDPVTKYIEELNDADPMFQKLTIRHLLQMRAGLKCDENYSTPFSGMARLYYGTNQLGMLRRMEFEYEPGTKHEYQSASTAILGIVVEKATKRNLAQYFEEKVWIPLGMENTGTWSLDDNRHKSAKAYSGLNATARDLAKIGRLYINKGKYKDKQIVSEEWIKQTLTPNPGNDNYQYQWYNFSGSGTDTTGNRNFPDSTSALKTRNIKYKKYQNYDIWKDESKDKWRLSLYTGQYYALGIMHQVLFIDPEKNIIIVRLGEKKDTNYLSIMYKLSNYL